MRVRTKSALLGAVSAYLGAQLWHTLRNQNRWPLCPYNMFNYTLPEIWEQLRIVLYDARSQATVPMDPWYLLPVEFFRVVSIMEQIFITNEDPRLREEFCARTIRLLNNSRWRDFDEIRASARSSSGLPFAALDIYLVEVDAVRCNPFDRTAVCAATLLHRHDPTGVIGDRAPDWRLVSP